MWNYMCIRWLINWSDSTKMHGATIRIIAFCLQKYMGFAFKKPLFLNLTHPCRQYKGLTDSNSIEQNPSSESKWHSVKKFSAFYTWVFQVFSFPQDPHQNPVYTSPLRISATCPTHFNLLYLITQTIFGEEYGPLSSSICSLLDSPLTSSLLGPKYSPQHPIFEHPYSTFLRQRERPSFTPIQNNRQNNSSVYRNT